MNSLNDQVRRARRRLILQQFIEVLPWCWFAALLTAALAIGVAKIWPPAGISPMNWAWSWIGGALGLGIVAAILWVVVIRRSALDAALEIDRRFGLKERVSTSLALTSDELETPAGKALLADAMKRVERLDVGEHFGIKMDRRLVLPLAPAALAFALAMFVNERGVENPVAAKRMSAEEVKNSAKSLEKKTAELRKQAEELGLKEFEGQLKELERGTKDLQNKADTDRKDALVKLNDFAKEMEKRREQLAAGNKLKEHLKQLKQLDSGPGEKLAKAMQQGDFKQAMKELEKLQQELSKGSLSKEQMEELAKQMAQMQQMMKELADRQEQLQQELKKQIEQMRQSGQLEEAAKLQKQLEKMQQQAGNMQKLSELAQKMGECSKCMSGGDSQAAMQSLAAMAKDLDQLAQQLSELEMLEAALDQIAQAKDSMNCANCQGMGCSQCQGMGNMFGSQSGMGLGRGQGQGPRPEERNKTGSYDSKVAQNARRGKQVIQGDALGPNMKGQVLESIKEEFESGAVVEADSLTNQKLPRSQREHARQYFDALNSGG